MIILPSFRSHFLGCFLKKPGWAIFLAIFYFHQTLLSAEPLVEQESTSSKNMPSISAELVAISSLENQVDAPVIKKLEDGSQVETYEVTAAQYCIFLNEVAAFGKMDDLYNEKMGSDFATGCIVRSEDGMSYSVIAGREQFPVVFINQYAAICYCAWLENGQLSDSSSHEETEQVGDLSQGCNAMGLCITMTTPSQGAVDISPSGLMKRTPGEVIEAEQVGDDALEFGKIVVFNVAPEFLEAFLYSKMKAWFLIPYVSWMSAEIIYALYHHEDALAETLVLHMLFDIAIVLADQLSGCDLRAVIGEFLSNYGLGWFVDGCTTIHHFIDQFVDGTIELGSKLFPCSAGDGVLEVK